MTKWSIIKTEYNETKQAKIELLNSDDGKNCVKLFTTDEDENYILKETWTSPDYCYIARVYDTLKNIYIDYWEFIR